MGNADNVFNLNALNLYMRKVIRLILRVSFDMDIY